ncbi:tetratricopeptide repeat protein, partial [Nostoc sp. CALU 1950]|uniref:tetratricopeptide repeat protein n=1 Tax=Nostoc sp. CALU 1950 TaxID=3104321 RepID=UPI003EB8288E
MLKGLWRWLKRYFQRLFGNKQTPPLEKLRKVEPTKQLTDAEYESLFLKLLAEVNDGLSIGGAKSFLAANRINEAHLVEWLRGFGERLLALPTPNDELATRMVRLGELSIGEVSVVAYDFGKRLEGEETKRRVAENAEGGEEKEAEIWFNQGVEQHEVGDFAGAIASYDSALKFKPDYHQAWNNRGNTLDKLGRFEEAIASYDRAIEIKPD